MAKITILGATGSIGQSTLSVIETNPESYEVFALVANNNLEAMVSLCLKWQPRFAAMANISTAHQLAIRLKEQHCNTEVLAGDAAIIELAAHSDADMVMAAMVGAAGLLPTMAAIKAGKRILLANKEALVMSGQFFMQAVQKYGASLLPVDSEHNAIFQCLPQAIQTKLGYMDLTGEGVSKILLTGSGGPFRYTEIAQLKNVTPMQAIAHPNWSMGPKISVDSATMMNKGLEYIEARWLFNASKEQLQVIIHPQSVIHSMVQYQDGSVLAQMGQPSMQTPIAYALAYPSRIPTSVAALNFYEIGELTFLKPDFSRYPCLKLAVEACYQGQAATTVLNAANEEAVSAFLNQQIKFTQIAVVTEEVLQCLNLAEPKTLEDLLEIDATARQIAQRVIRGLTR